MNGIEALREGEVVLLPTDTLPGLHIRADHPEAAARLRTAKGSDDGRPFLLLCADVFEVFGFARTATDAQRRHLERAWPGPVTALLQPRSATPPEWVHEGRSVAVRVPRPDPLRSLLRDLGVPIFSTSANPAGAPPARNLEEARASFPQLYWIDLPTPSLDAASTIVDLTRETDVVVRPGSFDWPPQERK